ncbi:DUF397 domain-containing protein [Streptomyces sp. 21So2-11]|uniref:DUF397 domain-containing protein n=1 Tax=Streptomyces sp. 21So2-11 TaxID=3144408 RepID=UPI00321C095C
MNIARNLASLPELAWFKSSYSGAEGGDCVEVAATAEAVCVRDSKVTAGPVLTVSLKTWAKFVGVTAGQTVT